MRTVYTEQLISKHTLEKIVHDLLLFGSLNKSLNPIHEHLKELINIFLDHWIDRWSIDILKGFTEFLRVKVLLFHFHQAAKYALNLVQHILFYRLIILASVLYLDDCFTERWDHIQLLKDTVHVTDAPEILETYKPWDWPLLLVKLDGPVCLSRSSPEDFIANIWLQVLRNE